MNGRIVYRNSSLQMQNNEEQRFFLQMQRYYRRDISRKLLYNNMYLGEREKCIFIIKMKYEFYIKRDGKI